MTAPETKVICDHCGRSDPVPTMMRLKGHLPAGWVTYNPRTLCADCWKRMNYTKTQQGKEQWQ